MDGQMPEDQSEVVAFLSQPESYGCGVRAVERCETHASLVFLAGNCAYKLKRAVKYPYLDYSTAERRRQMCERELEVNRRAAPQIYLEVKPVVRHSGGALAWPTQENANRAIDWVLVMRRFAQECLLGRMAKKGRLTTAMARQLGEAIADFHNSAEKVPGFGGAVQIARVIDENGAILHSHRGLAEKAEKLVELSRAALAHVSPLLDERRARFVRRCHGDLHLDNICVSDGKPLLIDAIEFNDDFACIDVLYDLAFPLMELVRLGLTTQANALINRYLKRTGDYEGLAALPLFVSCRAAIRAHTILSMAALDEKRHDIFESDSEAYLALSLESLLWRRPQLVAIGGVSGTGKSSLAYALAPSLRPQPGGIVIRSDIVRKRLWGIAETERLPPVAYTGRVHARVFEAMRTHAATVLEAGYSVILDGVYGARSDRDSVHRLAEQVGVPFHGLWLEAPASVMRDRIASRRGDASDATSAVLERQLETVTRPDDWIVLDAVGPPDRVLEQAQSALDARPLKPDKIARF